MRIERIPGPLASSYEKATRLVVESYYSRVADEIVAHTKEGLLLDLGTGPGYLPVEIAKRAPHIEIVGIDLCRKLVRMAKANALKAGLGDRIRFLVGNSSRLQFADESFDMLISTGMFHSLKDPVRVLREIHRVLRKGGEAWIFDPAQVVTKVNRIAWEASLTVQERFFLWLFRSLGLHKPIKSCSRSQVLQMIEATEFKTYSIEENDGEIRIKLEKRRS